MIVLDRLVRSLAAPPSWKSTVLTWSIAMLAVPLATMSLNVQAQRPAASSHASHVAGAPSAGGTGEGAHAASGMAGDTAASASGSHAGNAESSMPEHYTVQKGQWLTDIAGELTDSTDPTVKQNMANALYAANPNAFFANNPNRLKVGAVLNVPRPNGSVPSGATAGMAAHAASGAKLAAPASAATTAHMASTPAVASTPLAGTDPALATGPASTAAMTAAAAGSSATMGAAAVAGASATPNIAMAGGAPASPASMTAAMPSSAALGEGGASAVLSSASTVAAGSSAASSAISSDAAAAMAASDGGVAASGASVLAASSAHAWTGAIAPPPAASLTASGADAASGPASAQNVSSLQQLLQLKNRVLAAMQAHGLGSRASTVAAAGLPVSAALPGASSATAAGIPPSRAGALQGPLAIPALIVVLIVVVVAIWICLPARKRKPASPANGRSQDAPSNAGDPDAPVAGRGEGAGFASGAVTASAAVAGAATAAYAAQTLPHDAHPESRDEEARVDDEARAAHEAAQDATHEAGPDGNVDVPDEEERHPQLDIPPFSFEEGAAGGLPTHDPQRGAFAEEARTPYDTGLLIGLLEMHAHRREVERFQELAHELWELTDGDGPDWRRAASMGRGIDPDNPLYADDPFAAYRSEHDAKSGFAKPLPDIDLDLPALQPDSQPAPTPAPAPGDTAFEHAAQDDASPSTHDAAPLPEATPPAHVPVSEAHETLPLGLTDVDRPAPSVADEIEHGTSGAGSVAGLGAGTTALHSDVPGTADDALRGSDAGPEHAGAGAAAASDAPAAHGIPPHVATPGIGAPSFGALKLDFDLELTPNAAAPGSSPSSQDLATIARNKLDLATEYIDLGDRSGARTLLNEVLATQDPATRERAQALLATLA